MPCPRHLLNAVIFGLMLSAFQLVSSQSAFAAKWGENYFPNYTVTDQEGRELTFYDELIKDRIVAINFVYTHCPDLCSLGTARMAELKEQIGDRLGKDIFFYSITIDPERDTPEVLKSYADAFGAEAGWLFLTGVPAEIGDIGHKLGERSRKFAEHRNDLVLGNGRTGEWRRFSLMSDIGTLKQRVLEMDPVWRDQKRDLPKPLQGVQAKSYQIGDRPGEAMFLKACIFCHTVGDGDRIGPDLAGVTERREEEWLVRFLMAPELMLAKGDPSLVALDADYPGVTMPNLGLTRDDASDLIRYLENQNEKLNARGDKFDLTDHRGQKVNEQTYRDQHLLIYFGYSFCPDICPTSLATMAAAYDLLGGAEQAKIKPLFITLDPERDTVQALSDYVPIFHPDLTGLTGTPSATKAMADAYHVYFERAESEPSSKDYLIDHASALHLVGPHGQYLKAFDHTVSEQEIADMISTMLSTSVQTMNQVTTD